MTDLLGAARIEAGTLAPAAESLDLVDVVAAVCEGLSRPSHLHLAREIAADLPFVEGDPVLLHHVLTNLLDNALRHARSQVRVAAQLDGDRVLLAVEDDGSGIPTADRVRIFERFGRVEGSDRTAGSGLGLAIVKGFADAMGMTVSVEGGSLGGARFVLALPVARSAMT